MTTFNRGAREYEAVTGAEPTRALAELRRQQPQMYATLVDSVFGGPLSRGDLSRAERSLATVAALTALGGAEPQLRVHVRAALRAGVSPTELAALAEHLAVYTGYPRALNAVNVINEVVGVRPDDAKVRLGALHLNDHRTEVAEIGDAGPAVVFVHAVGLDWKMWRPVLGRLAEGRRLYAYDVRGHGAAMGAPVPFTMEDVADDLICVLDRLSLDQAHVVGLSYGGSIAQTAAVMHPDRVRSLGLLATTAVPFEAFEARAASAEADGMAAQIVPTLTRWFTGAALALNGPGVRYARDRIERADVTGWAATWRAMKGIDLLNRLDTLVCPTLVLAGEVDQSTTPAIMRQIAERIPSSRYEQLPATPHMQTLEQPDLVAAALDRFLPKDGRPTG